MIYSGDLMSKKLYIITIFSILTFGLIYSLYFPKDRLSIENRTAVKLNSPTIGDFLKGEVQANFENALTDQLPYSEESKKSYNYLASQMGGALLDGLVKTENYYISYNNLYLFSDYIVYPFRDRRKTIEDMRDNIKNINELIEKYPSLNFYAYYIEKDTDINFETKEKLTASDYLIGNLKLDESSMDVFSINSFEEYKNYFYITDHHWNNKGSYRAYRDLVSMLELGSPLEVNSEYIFENTLSGSKALETGTTDYRVENFYVNLYSFPPIEITINGNSVPTYGNGTELINNPPERFSYGDYYGGDNGETIFNTDNILGKSILVIGDSYDNALLTPLSTHYYKTYSIDLRYYEIENNKVLNFDSYVRDNYIDTVLFIGNIDFFTLDDFLVE